MSFAVKRQIMFEGPPHADARNEYVMAWSIYMLADFARAKASDPYISGIFCDFID